jgi:hypothetical protein
MLELEHGAVASSSHGVDDLFETNIVFLQVNTRQRSIVRRQGFRTTHSGDKNKGKWVRFDDGEDERGGGRALYSFCVLVLECWIEGFKRTSVTIRKHGVQKLVAEQ